MTTLASLLPKTVDGIIFSPQLVPPVLDGRKTVTRRTSRKWLKRKVGDLLFVKENWELHGWPGPMNPRASTVEIKYPAHAGGGWISVLTCPDGEWLERERARVIDFIKHAPIDGPKPPWDYRPYLAGFAGVWWDLNRKPGKRWSDNPEVVRIAFERAA